MTNQKIDGHEAYRDDPEYTAPEMEPGHGEDISPRQHPEFGVITAVGMAMPVAGGAIAGEAVVEELEEEILETTPRRS